MPAHAKPLRLVVSLLTWLIAGAALNVAVAWGLAILVDLTATLGQSTNPTRNPGSGGTWSTYNHFERFGASRTYWQPWPRIYLKDGSLEREQDAFMSSLPVRPSTEVSVGEVRDRRGWPLMALQCTFVNTVKNVWQPTYRVDDGIGLKQIRGGDSRGLRALPLRPLWPGFAVNTLFYAGVLWVLFAGPFAMRRMIRRRRGRCAICAYPIGQSPVCTECGASVMPTQLN